MNVEISPAREDAMEIETPEVGDMEAELRQWGARLDNLLATAYQDGSAARIDYRECLDDTREKYDAAEAKLAELKAAGRGNRESFRGGVQTAWSELATAFTRLAN